MWKQNHNCNHPGSNHASILKAQTDVKHCNCVVPPFIFLSGSTKQDVTIWTEGTRTEYWRHFECETELIGNDTLLQFNMSYWVMFLCMHLPSSVQNSEVIWIVMFMSMNLAKHEISVNHILSELPDFAAVFQCPIGSKMNPEKRCSTPL
ncbi:uncharacterized protein DEA37_0012350 [Paragonimus westermani]|uniref:Peptidase M13 C-terminal domain-containing protein n=1 Tax=Paragonimus westermani TaxID=34504 RepID=A0A5J4NQH4_9TREM|nr:uncharacterized protein DEA37_0012350 [Paragonimus westermani]